MCLEVTHSAIANYPEICFDVLKTGLNEKILYFSRNWHPGNPYATIWKFSKPIALKFLWLAFTKNFEWLANKTVIGQNSLSKFGRKICKNLYNTI